MITSGGEKYDASRESEGKQVAPMGFASPLHVFLPKNTQSVLHGLSAEFGVDCQIDFSK